MQKHLLISTNKWFSAVNESCLQLALALRDGGAHVVCASHAASPLQAMGKARSLTTAVVPLLGEGAIGWLRAWGRVSSLLLQMSQSEGARTPPASTVLDNPMGRSVDNFVDNSREPHFVWVFEGREHSLCALHRLVRPRLWKGWRLVRMRGQAAGVRDTWLNRLQYTSGLDTLVCAAQVVAKRIPFYSSLGDTHVFPFCSRTVREVLGLLSQKKPTSLAALHAQLGMAPVSVPFLPESPAIDASLPLFLVVGRFDPVKGHDSLLQAIAHLFRHTPPTRPFQLVLAGRSENIHAHDLARTAQELWKGTIVGHGARQCVEAFEGRMRLFLFDEKLPDVVTLMARAHFGVIPSLASEVICRVAVEFLQVGTPLVSSTAGALAEVIPEDAALFFPAGDVRALAEALAKALATLDGRGEAHAHLRERAFEAGWTCYNDGRYLELVERIAATTSSV